MNERLRIFLCFLISEDLDEQNKLKFIVVFLLPVGIVNL